MVRLGHMRKDKLSSHTAFFFIMKAALMGRCSKTSLMTSKSFIQLYNSSEPLQELFFQRHTEYGFIIITLRVTENLR